MFEQVKQLVLGKKSKQSSAQIEAIRERTTGEVATAIARVEELEQEIRRTILTASPDERAEMKRKLELAKDEVEVGKIALEELEQYWNAAVTAEADAALTAKIKASHALLEEGRAVFKTIDRLSRELRLALTQAQRIHGEIAMTRALAVVAGRDNEAADTPEWTERQGLAPLHWIGQFRLPEVYGPGRIWPERPDPTDSVMPIDGARLGQPE